MTGSIVYPSCGTEAFLQESRYRFDGRERSVSNFLVIETSCCILNVTDKK